MIVIIADKCKVCQNVYLRKKKIGEVIDPFKLLMCMEYYYVAHLGEFSGRVETSLVKRGWKIFPT